MIKSPILISFSKLNKPNYLTSYCHVPGTILSTL